jgi:hypothetical protein
LTNIGDSQKTRNALHAKVFTGFSSVSAGQRSVLNVSFRVI